MRGRALTAFWLVAATRALSPAVADPHLPVEGDIVGIHDPVVARERDTYYLYATNGDAPPATIRIRSSTDLVHWTQRGHVFDKLPEWATQRVPGARGAWAPDISLINGRYHLY